MKRYLPFIFLFLVFTGSVLGQSTSEEENLNKARLIIELINNTEWPVEGAAGNDTFVIAVIGQPSFIGKFKELTGANPKIKKTLDIKSISADANFGTPDMVLIGEKDMSVLAKVLKKTEKRPIMTVTDSPGFARYGVIVELVSDVDGKGKVEYIINKMVMRKAGLKISDDLIKKAKQTFGK